MADFSEVTHRASWGPTLSIITALTIFLVAFAEPTHSVGISAECGDLFTAPADNAPNSASGGDGSNIDQLDIIAGGIVAETADSFTTQITVKDLSTKLPENASSINWIFYWTFGETTYFARARVEIESPGQPLYSYGTSEPTGKTLTTTDAAAGAFEPGARGTVQVLVPKFAVGEPQAGDALGNVFAKTFIRQGAPGTATFLSDIDRGPKEEATYGSDYSLGGCVGEPAPGTATSPDPKLRVDDRTPKAGTTVRAKALLGVCGGHAGKVIRLQRKVGTTFKTVARKKLNRRCRAAFRVQTSIRKTTYRSFWKKQDQDHSAAASRPVTIRPHP